MISIREVFEEMRSIGSRSTEKEFMDEPDFKGEDLIESFRFIKITNMLGGGRLAAINCLKTALKDKPRDSSISVLDVGCGIGDIGRAIVNWGNLNGLKIRYTGLEKSQHILEAAKRQNQSDAISFISGDLFDENLPHADLIIISMVLHHLDEPQVIRAIRHLAAKARIALIISELERSPISYMICRLLSIFMKNSNAAHDALLSVRKGFTAAEMRSLIAETGYKGRVRRGLGWRILGLVTSGSD